MDSVMNYAALALTVLGALVAFLKVVAPLTPTEVDNRVLGVLAKLVGYLSGLVTPKMKA